MNFRYVIVVFMLGSMLFVQACARKVKPEETCNFVQNSVKQRISWGERTPVKLMIHKSVPDEHIPVIRESVAAWNDLIGREVLTIHMEGVGGDASPTKDGYSIIYLLDTWDEGKSREQARTSVYWKGSQIIEADIRLNSVNFEFSTSNDLVELGRVDLFSLMVHELGHVLGLSHIEEKGSVMRSELAKGQMRRTLIAGGDDDESIRCEY